jgi:hypothetical protein
MPYAICHLGPPAVGRRLTCGGGRIQSTFRTGCPPAPRRMEIAAACVTRVGFAWLGGVAWVGYLWYVQYTKNRSTVQYLQDVYPNQHPIDTACPPACPGGGGRESVGSVSHRGGGHRHGPMTAFMHADRPRLGTIVRADARIRRGKQGAADSDVFAGVSASAMYAL